MVNSKIKKRIMSIYLLFLLVCTGFIGFLVFEGVVDERGIEATTTRFVGGSGLGNYTNIQDAIDNASIGDVIRVYAGTYNERLTITKKITLIGNGTVNTTINGGGNGDVIYISVDWVNITGLTITNSGSGWSDAGIELYHVKNCRIINNNVSGNNNHGIFISGSYNNMFINNTILKNKYGIYLISYGIYLSSGNKFVNNTMVENGIFISGGSINCWNTHNIDISNTVNCKPVYFWKNRIGGTIPANAGQIILANCSYVLINNQNISNSSVGILLGFSSINIITNNTALNNNYGIYFYYSNGNTLINNTAFNNKYEGLYLYHSDHNELTYNMYSNNSIGIRLERYSNYNNIIDNIIEFNYYNGVNISDSNHNIIKSNVIRYNDKNSSINYPAISIEKSGNEIADNIITYNGEDGIYLNSANNNIIYNNTCSNNYGYGIYLDKSSINNKIYHNNVISNTQQAFDNEGTNNWDYNQEGNYWSDYNGQDNGAYGRVAGDGIGDTNIPHLFLDNYPFIFKFGWTPPPSPSPIGLGEIDSDGNYNILWENVERSTEYILEEDKNQIFSSPKIIYRGTNNFTELNNKDNGTYYYRVGAVNYYGSSDWSEIINITVDWLPNIPKNFTVLVNPLGNALKISWGSNKIDTKEYILEFINENINEWKQLDIITHPIYSYNHTGLNNGEKYYYRIQAKDNRDQLSNFSEIIYGIPWDSAPPAPPTGLKVITTTYDSITLNWNPNTENDLEGYHIFRNKISNPSDWGDPLRTFPMGTEEFIDIGLEERTTYYYVITAFDEVPNNSSYSNIAFGTTILGPHGPVINNSIDDFEILEDTIDDSSINLYNWFKDINDDLLEFKCEGNEDITVTIFQENGTVILIPKKDWNGKETLIFYASDSLYNISDDVTITVTPVNDPPRPGEIIKPKNNTKIDDGGILELEAFCNDSDLPYADKLTFKWFSNITGKLGEGNTLKDIILELGDHLITLEVSDSEGETSIATVHVSVLETPESDSDNDGMPNIWERMHGFNPKNPIDANEDFDNDNLINIEEYNRGTDPQDQDTDKDGLSDGDEIKVYHTNATNPDTDGDGHNDGKDDYPLDSTKWKKEKTHLQDNTWSILIAIIIVIAVITLIFLFVIKPRIGKKKKETVEVKPQQLQQPAIKEALSKESQQLTTEEVQLDHLITQTATEKAQLNQSQQPTIVQPEHLETTSNQPTKKIINQDKDAPLF